MKRARTLPELYSFSGFHAAAQLKGVFGDPEARIISVRRKKRVAPVLVVVGSAVLSMTGGCRGRAI